jgi:hypothetical protein
MSFSQAPKADGDDIEVRSSKVANSKGVGLPKPPPKILFSLLGIAEVYPMPLQFVVYRPKLESILLM